MSTEKTKLSAFPKKTFNELEQLNEENPVYVPAFIRDSADPDKDNYKFKLDDLQQTIKFNENISESDNVISATDTTYKAGKNISLTKKANEDVYNIAYTGPVQKLFVSSTHVIETHGTNKGTLSADLDNPLSGKLKPITFNQYGDNVQNGFSSDALFIETDTLVDGTNNKVFLLHIHNDNPDLPKTNKNIFADIKSISSETIYRESLVSDGESNNIASNWKGSLSDADTLVSTLNYNNYIIQFRHVDGLDLSASFLLAHDMQTLSFSLIGIDTIKADENFKTLYIYNDLVNDLIIYIHEQNGFAVSPKIPLNAFLRINRNQDQEKQTSGNIIDIDYGSLTPAPFTEGYDTNTFKNEGFLRQCISFRPRYDKSTKTLWLLNQLY